MSERRPGFPPENPAATVGDKKEDLLSSEHMKEIEALDRYFGTFFSGVKIEHRTFEDQQVLEKRFTSFLKFIEAKKFLTTSERQDLIEKMKERVHFSDPIEEAPLIASTTEISEQPPLGPAESKPAEVLPVKTKKKRAAPKKEQVVPTEVPEQKEQSTEKDLTATLEEIIASSGCTTPLEEFKKTFIANVRLAIQAKVAFENLSTQSFKKEGNKYTFYTLAKYQDNRESTVKCEVTFTALKRGLPGNQKIEQIPKWFMITLSK